LATSSRCLAQTTSDNSDSNSLPITLHQSTLSPTISPDPRHPSLQVSAATTRSETKVAWIKIRVWDTVHINSKTLDRAKEVTQKAYERAGIEFSWFHCTAVPTTENFACANPVGPNDFSVRIYPSAKDIVPKAGHFTGGASIPLIPHGARGIIFLFQNRLERTAKDEKIPLEVVLGITLAHEGSAQNSGPSK